VGFRTFIGDPDLYILFFCTQIGQNGAGGHFSSFSKRNTKGLTFQNILISLPAINKWAGILFDSNLQGPPLGGHSNIKHLVIHQ
jgi:hypothetical protein